MSSVEQLNKSVESVCPIQRGVPKHSQQICFWIASCSGGTATVGLVLTQEPLLPTSTVSKSLREKVLKSSASRAKIRGRIGRHTFSPQLSRSARRNEFSPRRTAETDASHQHPNNDECLRRSLHGSEAQSQHNRRATSAAPRSYQRAKAVTWTAFALAFQDLSDHFRPRPKIQILRNLTIALVAGVI